MVGLPTPEPAAAAPHDRDAELAAAATYLEARAPAPGLAAAVAGAGGDHAAVARLLVAALGVALEAGGAGGDVDAEGLAGCVQVLLGVLGAAGMGGALVTEVAGVLAGGKGCAELRLGGVVLLYNRVAEEQGAVRFKLLLSVVRLAASAALVGSIVETVLGGLDRFLTQWACGTSERREMYAACYDACAGAGMVARAFAFNVKRLELYNGAPEAEVAGVEAAAVAAIVDAVRLPELYRFDTLLELAAVRRLAGAGAGADQGSLHQLLSIFVKDDLDVFEEFARGHAALLDKHGIEVGAAADKMRLLTFASLGIDAQELSYQAIATALHVEEAAVEEWVIRAISSGLVDAKINQLKSNVAVYRSTQRMFTREEWQPLSERINIWKVNVAELLANLRETRQESQRAAGEAFSGTA